MRPSDQWIVRIAAFYTHKKQVFPGCCPPRGIVRSDITPGPYIDAPGYLNNALWGTTDMIWRIPEVPKCDVTYSRNDDSILGCGIHTANLTLGKPYWELMKCDRGCCWLVCLSSVMEVGWWTGLEPFCTIANIEILSIARRDECLVLIARITNQLRTFHSNPGVVSSQLSNMGTMTFDAYLPFATSVFIARMTWVNIGADGDYNDSDHAPSYLSISGED